jgi:D-sedoheptulose 7-phosphate isomerase
MSQTMIIKRIEESISVKQTLITRKDLIEKIEEISEAAAESLRRGGKIIFAGNGGSFADSIHLAAEFVARFQIERQALASLALGANSSILTAVSNDYSFNDIFARELAALGHREDLFIGISTSGNSENIIRAIQKAKEIGLKSFCFTGESGGLLAGLADCLCVPSKTTARIQESHILIGHILCELVEEGYRPE